MLPPIATGTSDFLGLRADQALYVDKTAAFVARVLTDRSRAQLFCRPRRFGKTLNMTTLRAFVERGTDPGPVREAFAGLAIEHAGDAVWQHFQVHPVIWLSFKDIKAKAWTDAAADLARRLGVEVERHEPMLRAALPPERLRDLDDLRVGAPLGPAHRALLERLSQWLHEATGHKPIVLIDEYDTPIHAAFEHGYFDDAIDFFRPFFGAGLKDNPHVERSVMTGILRVAIESVFSGLNHLAVHSMLRDPNEPAYADAFGFTQAEVDGLCDLADLDGTTRDAMKAMYNGYRLGGFDLYTPWSLTQCLASHTHRVQPYWVHTSDNSPIRDLLTDHGVLASPVLEAILRGEAVTAMVDEHTALRDVERRPEALLSFLVLAGYLRVDTLSPRGLALKAQLRLPNLEVRLALQELVQQTLSRVDAREDLGPAVLAGNAPLVQARLQALLTNALSYHLTAGRSPERVYQAFVAGLLIVVEDTHIVATEVETGLGRADVLVTPRRPGLPGVVMELKVGGAEALDDALEQARVKDYAARLRQVGAEPVRLMAAAFDGKQVRVGFAVG